MPTDIWPRDQPIKLDLGEHAIEKDAIHNLSGGAFVGERLYLASDEGRQLLHLRRTKPSRYASCEAIELKDIFDLPGKEASDKEFDLEALAVDTLDKRIARLWMIGSHAMGHDAPPDSQLKRLGLKRQRNRLLFGCVELDEQGGVIKRTGRHLRITGGKETHTTEFLSALRAAPPQATGFIHEIESLTGQSVPDNAARNIGWFAPYTLASTKENGLDIEGLAIRRRDKDPSRVVALVGMRGPVIDGFAVVVEVRVRDQDARELAIEGEPHFHLLNLKGFGVRDLEWRGDDLIILAGPTMTRQKESALFRWRGAWGATGARGAVRNVSEVGTIDRIGRLPMDTDDGPEAIATVEPGSSDHMLLRDGENTDRIDGSIYKAEVYRVP